MADHYSICLLTVMDRLWFHQIILVSSDSTTSTTLLHFPNSNQQPHPSQQNPFTHHSQNEEERPTRMNPASTVRSRRSHSSSTERRPRNMIRSSSIREVDRNYSMISCRSLRELELEEVKGFIDLGFKFNKQNTNPSIARVIPGLLKFLDSNLSKFDDKDEEQEDDDNDDDEEKGIMRPYLSEAWLIKRPNSALLDLIKLPNGATCDIKKHLKFWARSVAFVIHQCQPTNQPSLKFHDR